MKNLLSLGFLCASLVAAPLAAHADTIGINGSQSITLGITGVNGSSSSQDISGGVTSIQFNTSAGHSSVSGDGVNDFYDGEGSNPTPGQFAIPFGTSVTSTATLLVGAPAGWSLTITGYGTFTAASIEEVSHGGAGSSSSVGYYLLGTFTPTDIYDTADTTFVGGESSLLITVQNTGGSYSSTASFATPPAPPPTTPSVPEPSSLALLGTGILGGVGVLRRRFKA